MTAAVMLRLACGSLLLVVISAAAVPLIFMEQRRRKLNDRISQHATPYARATLAEVREKPSGTAAVGGGRALLQWLTRLVAFDPAHSAQYPLAWWIVWPAALLFARILIALAQTIFGSSILLALPVVWLLSVRQFYRWCEQRRLRTLFEQFPDALAMLVRAVRVGIPVTEGMRSIATDCPDPTGREFAQVVDQISLGVTLEQALRGLAERNQLPEYGFFATALALQSETGGTVSDTLERLSDVIRKRVSLREHARALAAEARTSIMILAALPVFTGAALAVLNPDYISTLFIDPQGQRIFTIALGSLSVGIITMRTIVSRSLS
ncbi:MAG TPA: type II secretion system F family protein [Acetobacteraceae bacterium]|jgi:tight adherence protein B|nr:type II secretion system F family protein [Acetobacteraceae bacterium]